MSQGAQPSSQRKSSSSNPSSGGGSHSPISNFSIERGRPVTAVILKRKDGDKEKELALSIEDEFSAQIQGDSLNKTKTFSRERAAKTKSSKFRESSSSRQPKAHLGIPSLENNDEEEPALETGHNMIFKKKKQFLVDDDDKSVPNIEVNELSQEGEKDSYESQEPNLVPESNVDSKQQQQQGNMTTSSNKTRNDPTKYFYRSNDITITGYPLNDDLLDYSDDGGRSQADNQDGDESDTLSELDPEESQEGDNKRAVVTGESEEHWDEEEMSETEPPPKSHAEKGDKTRSNSMGKQELFVKRDSLSRIVRPTTSDGSERVNVIIRCRPLSKKELDEGHETVVKVVHERNEIEVRRPSTASSTTSSSNTDQKVFAFDAVYDCSISQRALYDEAFRPLVDSVLQGFNGTIFAYGQTGTGKTYTMEGIHREEEHHGVIPNAFKHIFKQVAENPNKQYLIRASYLEIYQEDIRDLLSRDRKQHRELKESASGVYVKDLSTFLCSNFNEINELMSKGNKSRAVGATNMNERSSRSHAIFQITVEVSEEWPDGRNHIRVGKLNLVDLAGSERQTKTGATGERLKEATKINLSLSALGNVIGALVDGKSSHIPYRDSKLTRLLQDSLGGNSRTIMVATIGPASFNWDETMTTLRYASRAKKIKNKPKVNEDPKDAVLRQYQEEIARLRAELIRKKEQQSMLEEQVEEEQQQQGKSDSTKGISSGRREMMMTTTTNLSEQLKIVEEQRLKELTPLLEPYGLDPSNDPKDIMSQLEQRRQALLEDNLTVTTERDKLLKKLEETQSLVKSTEDECTKLTERIQWLESKVLTGGKSLLDHTNEQQKLIEEKQKELEEQNKRYEEVRKKLEENQLTTVELRNTLEELDQDYQVKTKKLKKLTQKLLTTREELGALSEEYSQNRKEIQNVLVELKKELSLKRLVIDNFIPSGSRKMIENRIQWDEAEEMYKVNPYDSTVIERPKINRMLTSPLYNLSTLGPIENVDNVYYTDENILQLGLELPTSLVRDYVPPVTDPYYTSLVKRAIEDAEKEVVIDCRRVRKKRTKTAASPITDDYFQFGENLVRRVKSARLPLRNTLQYQDFTVVLPNTTGIHNPRISSIPSEMQKPKKRVIGRKYE